MVREPGSDENMEILTAVELAEAKPELERQFADNIKVLLETAIKIRDFAWEIELNTKEGHSRDLATRFIDNLYKMNPDLEKRFQGGNITLLNEPEDPYTDLAGFEENRFIDQIQSILQHEVFNGAGYSIEDKSAHVDPSIHDDDDAMDIVDHIGNLLETIFASNWIRGVKVDVLKSHVDESDPHPSLIIDQIKVFFSMEEA